VFREVIAVIASPDRPPTEVRDWLAFGAPDHNVPIEGVWNRLFSPWAASARSAAERLVNEIAAQRRTMIVAEYDASTQHETARSQRWLRVKADHLCGTFIAPTRDLFNEPEPGPAWRREQDPMKRLVSYGTDRNVTGSKRREASDSLDVFRAMHAANAAPGPIVSRPAGMLMLVPRDAR
jgi:hypothetical protein